MKAIKLNVTECQLVILEWRLWMRGENHATIEAHKLNHPNVPKATHTAKSVQSHRNVEIIMRKTQVRRHKSSPTEEDSEIKRKN